MSPCQRKNNKQIQSRIDVTNTQENCGLRTLNFFGPRVYPRLTNPHTQHWERNMFVSLLTLPTIDVTIMN
jgi:hypothetical protein